jgi:hypothetical protein
LFLDGLEEMIREIGGQCSHWRICHE